MSVKRCEWRFHFGHSSNKEFQPVIGSQDKQGETFHSKRGEVFSNGDIIDPFTETLEAKTEMTTSGLGSLS